MARSEKKRRHTLSIIEMFAGLGLPVCDDEEAIKAKRDEQRSARNRELNSTKGSVAAKAQQWFDDVNALLGKREELLGVVYDEFCSLGDTLLCASLDGGRTTLGPDTQAALKDIATSWCRARSDLANRWVQQFLEQRGLKGGEEIDRTSLVDNLKASVRGGKVALSWSIPPQRFDEVRIVRTLEGPDDDGTETIVYEGKDTTFLDTTVAPKSHYCYRAYTIYEGRRSLTSVTATTRRPPRNWKRAALPVAAAVLLLAVAGAVVWSGGVAGSGGGRAERASARDTAATTDAGADDAATSDDSWLAAFSRGAADASHDEDGSGDEPTTEDGTNSGGDPDGAQTAAPPPPADPPYVDVVSPPTLAFAGQSLRIELSLSRDVAPELVDARLEGLELRRFEWDADPPAIRFSVAELPSGTDEAQASWSFQLADENGVASNTITGSCLVLGSGD